MHYVTLIHPEGDQVRLPDHRTDEIERYRRAGYEPVIEKQPTKRVEETDDGTKRDGKPDPKIAGTGSSRDG